MPPPISRASSAPPTCLLVDIEGSPFLTQVAARSIGTVHVVADQVGLRTDQTLTVAQVDLVLSDVTTDDWFDTMNVSHAEGTARIDYNVLQALAGVPLTYVGDGRVEIVTTTTLFGRDVSARITGEPRLNVSRPDRHAGRSRRSTWRGSICRISPRRRCCGRC